MATALGGLLTSPFTAMRWAQLKAKEIPRLAPWAVPLVIGGGWFVYPALTDNFKASIGLIPDPEAEAEKAAAVAEMNKPIKLSAAAQKAVDNAHHPAFKDINPAHAAASKAGDFSHLHATWDKHFQDSLKVRDDDDDDDDEEEEEEEEEE